MKQVNRKSRTIEHGFSETGPTRRQKLFSKISGIFVMVGLFIMFATTAISSTAMAQVPGQELAPQDESGIGLFILIVGIVLAILTWLASRGSTGGAFSGAAFWFGILAAALIIIPVIFGFVVLVSPAEPVIAFCDKPENVEDPLCKLAVPLKWTVVLETDLDVAPATYPAAPMTTCNAAIGGTTGAWVAGDKGNLQNNNRIATTGVHIDTDLADSDPLWMEPNCIFIEIQRIQLIAGPESLSGPITEQRYFARIDSISVTRLPTDNATVEKSVFFEDTQGRHHIGYQFEDGSWNEACPEFIGQDLPRSGCQAIPVGVDDGTGDTTGAIASAGFRIFWVWEDRGPFAFRDNNGAVWTLVFSIGSQDDWHTYQFVATMDKSATDNT